MSERFATMSRERRAMVRADRLELARLFPEIFLKPSGGRTKVKLPLKIGISADLMGRLGWPISRVNLVLTDYTHGPRYCRACIAGADRIDLDGNPCGTVSEEQAKHAAGLLREHERRITAERQAAQAVRAAQGSKPAPAQVAAE